MPRLMKLTPLLIFACLLLFVSAAAGQTGYPSLPFARETNAEGTTDYVLKPVVEEIYKKVGGKDKPYQLVGAVARPSKQAAVLLFLNGQTELQFRPETDKNVIITVDSAEISNLKYEVVATEESEVVKLQIANVLISLKDLQRIAKASSVSLKLGPVSHRLAQDNHNALRYLVSEIEKDQK
jgi:hypothetical protein